MPMTACCWCSKLVYVDELPDTKHDTVCSEKCGEYERWFRTNWTDERIGKEYEDRFGINTHKLAERKKIPRGS